MKRNLIIFVLVVINIVFLESSQQQLDTAQRIAANFIVSGNDYFEIVHSENIEIGEKICAYFFELSPKGYVITGADDTIYPIIAYSLNSKSKFQNIQSLVDLIKRDILLQMKYYQENPALISQNVEIWRQYAESDFRFSRPQQWPEAGTTETGGWVETVWHQSIPYNSFCPVDPDTGERSVVGCVATAMSQIINFHEFIGNVSFDSDDQYQTWNGINIDEDHDLLDFPDFEELTEYLISLNEHYQNGEELTFSDLAALNFASGISVQMGYSSIGSGAYTTKVAYALRNKFDYPSANVIYTTCDSFYYHLRSNMIDAMPVELGIVQPDLTGGHAIVCDGYNSDDYYHLNFGWGEYSPDDIVTAWYYLPQGMPAGYSIINEGIMYINPAESLPYVWFEPQEFDPGDEVTIYYGEVGTLFYSDQVFIHCGYDGWNEEIDTIAMSFDNEFNRWKYQLTIPDDHEVFDFCFTDGDDHWDNNSEYDWHITIQESEIPYIMDGLLDDTAELILSSEDQNLWISYTDNYFYIASNPANTENDVFILITTDFESMTASPWAKAGEVSNWQYYLADEGTNSFCSWFDENDNIVSQIDYARAASDEVLEGYLAIENYLNDLDSLFTAAAIYETIDNGFLLNQLPEGNGDGNIDFNEYHTISINNNNEISGDEIEIDNFINVFPNPFHSQTTISYCLQEKSNVDISIYNIKGQKIRNLTNTLKDAGDYQVRWDGKDDRNRPVGSGLYLYRLRTGSYSQIRKIVLIR